MFLKIVVIASDINIIFKSWSDYDKKILCLSISGGGAYLA